MCDLHISEKTETEWFVNSIVCKFRVNKPDVYRCFLYIVKEYKHERIPIPDVIMLLSSMFSHSTKGIEKMLCYLPEVVEKEVGYEDLDMLRPAKRSRNHDNAATPMSQAIHSSCASGNSTDPRLECLDIRLDAENKRVFEFKYRTVAISKTEPKLLVRPVVYQQFIGFVKEIKENRNILDTMNRAKVLQGYPDLIEKFDDLLPVGHRIVDPLNDSEMSTD